MQNLNNEPLINYSTIENSIFKKSTIIQEEKYS